MNIQSILILTAILITAVIVAYRYIHRQKRTGGCGTCNCSCHETCKLHTLALISTATVAATAQTHQPALIPYPREIHISLQKPCIIQSKCLISTDDRLLTETTYLKALLHRHFPDISLHDRQRAKADFKLCIDTTLRDNDEQYTLTVNHKGIAIHGATPHAVFNAINTLDQWIRTNSTCNKNRFCIAPVQIRDIPRYRYRALMLDPARHYLPVSDIKRYIDEMARFKFNTLQLHLSDDQGFRIQVYSHPQLTQGQQHYTQDQIRELIRYAATRHVTIVPEIDIPGHTYGILRTHPQYLCQHTDTTAWGHKLRTDVMLCASQPEVYKLCSDIINEIAALFPSPYIHLGGDESLIRKNWSLCPRCQALKARLHYTSDDLIMGYFFSHFWETLRAKGKKPILWVEMDNIVPPATQYLFPYPKDVTLVTWRNALTPTAIRLTAASGNDLIMAPGEHCYFDYPQYPGDLPENNNWGMPILTLKDAYQWDPAYPELNQPTDHITGVMGTLWGEAINDINRAFYMTYPRALALAEAGWSTPDNRHWTGFKTRLYPILNDMMQRGIPFRVPFEIYAGNDKNYPQKK